jgi:hypothetical protein
LTWYLISTCARLFSSPREGGLRCIIVQQQQQQQGHHLVQQAVYLIGGVPSLHHGRGLALQLLHMDIKWQHQYWAMSVQQNQLLACSPACSMREVCTMGGPHSLSLSATCARG